MFVKITKKQFEYFLYQYKLDGVINRYKEIKMEGTNEYVYLVKLPYDRNEYYIYSSVDMDDSISRDYGDDRIRCVRYSDGRYKRMFWCNRTVGWEKRLKKALKGVRQW